MPVAAHDISKCVEAQAAMITFRSKFGFGEDDHILIRAIHLVMSVWFLERIDYVGVIQ